MSSDPIRSSRVVKVTSILLLIGLLSSAGRDAAAEIASEPDLSTNAVTVGPGWLHVASHDLVLDIHHESLEYGARRDASEFVAAVLNVLVTANYTVHLSCDFIQGEIDYYRTNQGRELPVEMSAAILNCLEKARDTGVLDWDCFKGHFSQGAGLTVAERHLPWSEPPLKSRAIRVTCQGETNAICLHLSLKWASHNYGGGVQHSRRPGGLAGETVMVEGKNALWAFAAVMRLKKGEQTLFKKVYPREEWQRTYVTIYDQPLWKTSQAILQDLATGLRPPPAVVEETGKTKKRKTAKQIPQQNSAR